MRTFGAIGLIMSILLTNGLLLSAQQKSPPGSASLLSFSVTPNFSIPMGGDASVFGVGGGAVLSGEYRLPALPIVFLGGSVGYSFVPLKSVTSLSLMQVSMDAGLRFDLLPKLILRARGSGGYAFGLLNNAAQSGSTPFLAAGADLSWSLIPSLSLGIGGVYRYYLNLYNDIAASLGVSWSLPTGRAGTTPQQPKPTPLVAKQTVFGNIFPILHAYYDTNPVGRLVLFNQGSADATDLKVSFLVRQFMDAPKLTPVSGVLKPGENKTIDIYGLFKNNVFEIKEPTKVPAEIDVSYTYNGQPLTLSDIETINVLDRNALTWDDTGKAAAFVMPKEPSVLALSNQINSIINPSVNSAVDGNLQIAMALHDALRLYGIRYVSPPLTSYADRSKDKTAIDSVKFPLQTIEYRSGDCSDLTVLYCSLLESIQIETAFITIPGHIFMAFALKGSEEDVRKDFNRPDQLIFRAGKAWVPIEVTDRDESFLVAWNDGAQEWRENFASNHGRQESG